MSSPEPASGKPDGKKPGGPRRGGRRRIIILVALCVVVFTAVVTSLRTKQRVEHETAFCTSSCHHESQLSKDGAWHATGHADVACQSCHTTSTGTGFKLAWQAFVGSAHPVTHGKATAGACVSCHQKQPADWRVIAETRGHREHAGVKNVDCLSCHASGTHKEAAPAAVCITCHEDQRLHKATTANAETCLSCHGYTASQKNARQPSTLVCEKCHSDPAAMLASSPTTPVRPIKDVTDHVVHGGVACQLCHNAHGKKVAAPAGQPVCAKCHQFETFQVGSEDRKGPEGHRKCEGCHKPHAPITSALKSCVECHEQNAKGLIGVKGAVKKPGQVDLTTGLTKAVGGTTALKHDSCASCHLPHTWRAERSGCMQCHKDETQKFLTRSPAEHTTCVTCHEVPGPPPSGAVCVKCHAATKGNHVALAPAKHKDCTSCHDPHAPRPAETRTSCAKCHSAQVSQVSMGPEGHSKSTCLGCHQPHENPLPKANVCANCHADKAKLVATAGPPKHKLCISCHEKHTFKITNVATACSKCHGAMFPATTAGMATPGTSKVPHSGDCKGCHTVHGSPGVPQTSCLKCHTKVATEFNPPNEKHGVCRSCHQPHTAASAAVATCASCHAAKADVATKWPPVSAHAKACNGCHQQHDVRVKKVCADCHAAETASAMGSKHQCVQCHAPHTAPPGTGPAWWTRCNQCHAAKVQSATLRGPTHSVCKNCHQPHRFAVPTCASCHKDIGAKGLHAVPKHAANCASCHDPHVKSVPSPQQCLACHTTRRNHEPTAAACQACHPFK